MNFQRVTSALSRALVLPLVLLSAVSAKADVMSGTASAKPPREVLARMKRGGRSLHYQALRVGPKGSLVGIHVYAIPAGRARADNSYAPVDGKPRTGRIRADEIRFGPATGIVDSPYYLEVFRPSGTSRTSKLKRVNSLRFTESRDVDYLQPRFLNPKKKIGNAFLLTFASLGTYDVFAFSFPKGLDAIGSVDHFSGGGAGGGGGSVNFDHTDARGFMTVDYEPYSSHFGSKPARSVWNGKHFVPQKKFVVRTIATHATASRTVMSTKSKSKQQIVSDAQNGSAITLKPGATLIVRLNSNPSTGASWALVSMSGMPVRLVSHKYVENANQPAGKSAVPIMGGGGTEEFQFVVSGKASYTRAFYLKMLYLRSFDKGIEDARLWEVKVTVPQS